MNLSDVDQVLRDNALSSTTILMRLKRSMWDPYAFDANATNQVVVRAGVVDAGRFNKRLMLNCAELKSANSAFNDVYQYAIKNSVPWMDDGWRWLPATLYKPVAEGLGDRIKVALKLADALAANWPTLIARDMQRLGPLANPDDYPADIRARYAIDLRFSPVPDTSDFRVAISDEHKQSLLRAIDDAKAAASSYLITELLKPVKAAAEKLKVPIGHEGSIFRDSLLTNITDMVNRARSLNFTNDPVVAALIDDVATATSGIVLAPDRLREDIGARNDAQAKLDAIMAKMAGLF